MGSIPTKYAIATNYDHFVLFDKNFGDSKCHQFYFHEIVKDENKLKEFIGIFSYQNLVLSKDKEELVTSSLNEEKEFTNEFYKLFHETRLMIFKEFSQGNDKNRKQTLVYTQKFLDRLIFLFFIEKRDDFLPDKNLFSKRIVKVLEGNDISEYSTKLFDNINELFTMLDKGSDTQNIFGYNGGLYEQPLPKDYSFLDFRSKEFFKETIQSSKFKKITIENEKIQNILDKHKNNLSPLIENLLILNSFDFSSDVNVNILGHIFEQSISDLEELNKSFSFQRKKHGIFYTSEKLTDFVCRNAIVSYLTNKNSTTVSELVEEYSSDLETLEEKLKKTTVLDPSCGSGAFLNKAADILLEIYEEIRQYQKSIKYDTKLDPALLTAYQDKSLMDMIIETNICGVDINPESVSITQLSLFLKLAAPKRKLIKLDNYIKQGNSVIDDDSVVENPFLWNKEFSDILIDEKLKKENLVYVDGFQVIVGNPPWNIIKPTESEFFAPYFEKDYPEKKFRMLKKPEKKRFVEDCRKDKKINLDYEKYVNDLNKQKKFFIDKTNYKFQGGSNDVNIFKVFLEKTEKLLAPNGVCGFIIPSQFYIDKGSQKLLEFFFTKNNPLILCSFINKKGIFEDIHKQTKFCTFFYQKSQPESQLKIMFSIININDLNNFHQNCLTYKTDEIKKCSANSFNLLEFKSNFEKDIVLQMYSHPILQDEKWEIKAAREIHMKDDSKYFHTSKIGYPLYEGKMINQFRDDHEIPRYWIDSEEGERVLISREKKRQKIIFKKLPIPAETIIDSNFYRIVWRNITNSIDKRTLYATILPPNVFVGNSMYFIKPRKLSLLGYKQHSFEKILYLCGMMNSLPVDYVIRHKVVLNASIFIVMTLPIPLFENNPLQKKIILNTAKLICIDKKYLKLADNIGIKVKKYSDEERLTLEAQINANAAKLYNLSREQLETIFEKFPIESQKLKNTILDELNIL